MSDEKLTVQWYGDNGHAMVFYGVDCIATITEGNRGEVTERLGQLGLKPKRWKRCDWGDEASLVSRQRVVP